MFTVCQAVIVNKVDTRKFFKFDDEAFVQRVHELNPMAEIFFLSAKTGEGFDEWTDWLRNRISEQTGK
jgi:hydrogenase nickel incorporation protein HypB